MDTREHRTGNLSVMFVKSQATIRDSDGGGGVGVETRTCFRCGTVGHVANNCSHPRTCFKCLTQNTFQVFVPRLRLLNRPNPRQTEFGG